jgi:RNA polymerase sigma factor (sigma-70 family)
LNTDRRIRVSSVFDPWRKNMPKEDALPDSRAEFPLTAWSVIRQAQELPTAARISALGELVQWYRKPIYAYFRSQRKSHADAEDLTQAFLTRFLEREKILAVDQDLGRFRDWLRACLRNFMRSQGRRENAAKRRPPQGLLSLHALTVSDGKPWEPGEANDPESALDDAWRRELLQRALRAVWEICERKQRDLDYEIFVAYYCAKDAAEATWQELAAKHELGSWKMAARKADWVKDQLAKAICAEVARYAATEEEIDEEIRELLK